MISRLCVILAFLLSCSLRLCPAFAERTQAQTAGPVQGPDKIYTPQQLRQDFDVFWQDIHDQYAYLDTSAAD